MIDHLLIFIVCGLCALTLAVLYMSSILSMRVLAGFAKLLILNGLMIGVGLLFSVFQFDSNVPICQTYIQNLLALVLAPWVIFIGLAVVSEMRPFKTLASETGGMVLLSGSAIASHTLFTFPLVFATAYFQYGYSMTAYSSLVPILCRGVDAHGVMAPVAWAWCVGTLLWIGFIVKYIIPEWREADEIVSGMSSDTRDNFFDLSEKRDDADVGSRSKVQYAQRIKALLDKEENAAKRRLNNPYRQK